MNLTQLPRNTSISAIAKATTRIQETRGFLTWIDGLISHGRAHQISAFDTALASATLLESVAALPRKMQDAELMSAARDAAMSVTHLGITLGAAREAYENPYASPAKQSARMSNVHDYTKQVLNETTTAVDTLVQLMQTSTPT